MRRLGRLHTETGRPDLAREDWRAARDVIQRVLNDLDDPALRGTFMSSPAMGRVQNHARPVHGSA